MLVNPRSWSELACLASAMNDASTMDYELLSPSLVEHPASTAGMDAEQKTVFAFVIFLLVFLVMLMPQVPPTSKGEMETPRAVPFWPPALQPTLRFTPS
ncbi:cortexin-1 isoform X2 [Numida meleagris]|uniref:cortexin-1 isoform X2 n=1 Tax=Numida meleagris TaxID=8996 RepID=UPI000B3DC406|nr:cortexin-1 isoform X2 [Numida meleagris]